MDDDLLPIEGPTITLPPYIVNGNSTGSSSGGSGWSTLGNALGGLLGNVAQGVGAGIADRVTSSVSGNRTPNNEQYANPTSKAPTQAQSAESTIAGIKTKNLLVGLGLGVLALGGIALATRKS